jgi:hypothetical protein
VTGFVGLRQPRLLDVVAKELLRAVSSALDMAQAVDA